MSRAYLLLAGYFNRAVDKTSRLKFVDSRREAILAFLKTHGQATLAEDRHAP